VDPRERYEDIEELFRAAFDGFVSRMWGALPGVVTAVTNNGNTVEVQFVVNGRKRNQDQTLSYLQMPKVVEDRKSVV
jgi:hypothetical protein